MITPADELRAAAAALRDLATRTTITLERNETQWTDLTISDKAPRATPSPMVWSQYAAAMGPGAGNALADWLESAPVLHEPKACEKHDGCSPLGCDWCGDEDWPCADIRSALAVARAVTGGPR